MRIIAIAAALATLSFAGSALATECDTYTEHKLTVFDWTKNASGKPDTSKPLRIRSENCMLNEAGGTKIMIDQFMFPVLGDKVYTSLELLNADTGLLLDDLKARKRFGADKLNKMAAALEEQLSDKVADATGKPVIDVSKLPKEGNKK
jgi:hypothetical protein